MYIIFVNKAGKRVIIKIIDNQQRYNAVAFLHTSVVILAMKTIEEQMLLV